MNTFNPQKNEMNALHNNVITMPSAMTLVEYCQALDKEERADKLSSLIKEIANVNTNGAEEVVEFAKMIINEDKGVNVDFGRFSKYRAMIE